MSHPEDVGTRQEADRDTLLHRKSSDAVLTRDTDGFMVGDSVFVKGTMAGRIAYIGETGLGAGDWAGVVLDEPIGKTDGTVGGHHYFQCEPRHGIFSRLHRLSRARLGPTPEVHDVSPERRFAGARRQSRGSPTRHGSPAGSSPSPRQSPVRQPRAGAAAPSRGSPGRAVGSTERRHSEVPSPVTSAHHRAGGPPPLRRHSEAPPGHAHHQHAVKVTASHAHHAGRVTGGHAPQVGDRVSVASASGRKQGVLRFMGNTDFAEGCWAGVELDEPRGRNNGTVAGTWYFDCRPQHGLFAPAHKVCRLPGAGSPAACPRALPDEDGFF